MDVVVALLGRALKGPGLGHYGRVIVICCERRALGLFAVRAATESFEPHLR
jgi:hypothetical protein